MEEVVVVARRIWLRMNRFVFKEKTTSSKLSGDALKTSPGRFEDYLWAKKTDKASPSST